MKTIVDDIMEKMPEQFNMALRSLLRTTDHLMFIDVELVTHDEAYGWLAAG